MNKSVPFAYVIAGTVVGALSGYGVAMIQAVSDLRIMNQWDLAYGYDYEGFSSTYVAASVALGLCAFGTAVWRRRPASVGMTQTETVNGIDQLLDQARANRKEEQQPVAV